MTKSGRKQVYEKCGGRCGYCGSQLDDKWQVDHIMSKTYCAWHKIPDVDSMNNLMPACRKCNHYKHSHHLESFRTFMLKFHKRLANIPKITRVPRTEKRKEYMQDIADRYGITVDIPFSGVFYFETLKTEQ